ncbi:hypothetical protein LPJ81_006721, partial [Coemansia sp. IMI 209127]
PSAGQLPTSWLRGLAHTRASSSAHRLSPSAAGSSALQPPCATLLAPLTMRWMPRLLLLLLLLLLLCLTGMWSLTTGSKQSTMPSRQS